MLLFLFIDKKLEELFVYKMNCDLENVKLALHILILFCMNMSNLYILIIYYKCSKHLYLKFLNQAL